MALWLIEWKTKGWNAPDTKTYVPFGNFENAILTFEKIKQEMPHSLPIWSENLDYIWKLKGCGPVLGKYPPMRIARQFD